MRNSFPAMRDEAAIPHLTRTRQEDGTVCYFFGDTTIRVTETQTAGKIHLTPLSGDQAACGEWVDLDEEQVRRYCDLLTRYLNSVVNRTTWTLNADTNSVIQTARV